LRTGATDGTGAFAFTALPAGTYSIGVTNLPAGLVVPDTDVIGNRRGLVALLDGQQLHEPGFGAVDAHRSSWLQSSPALPRPAATQLGDGEIGHRSDWAMLIVIAMASVLAASVLFASAGPIRGRRPTWR
jgi:hypothetical protein